MHAFAAVSHKNARIRCIITHVRTVHVSLQYNTCADHSCTQICIHLLQHHTCAEHACICCSTHMCGPCVNLLQHHTCADYACIRCSITHVRAMRAFAAAQHMCKTRKHTRKHIRSATKLTRALSEIWAKFAAVKTTSISTQPLIR